MQNIKYLNIIIIDDGVLFSAPDPYLLPPQIQFLCIWTTCITFLNIFYINFQFIDFSNTQSLFSVVCSQCLLLAMQTFIPT